MIHGPLAICCCHARRCRRRFPVDLPGGHQLRRCGTRGIPALAAPGLGSPPESPSASKVRPHRESASVRMRPPRLPCERLAPGVIMPSDGCKSRSPRVPVSQHGRIVPRTRGQWRTIGLCFVTPCGDWRRHPRTHAFCRVPSALRCPAWPALKEPQRGEPFAANSAPLRVPSGRERRLPCRTLPDREDKHCTRPETRGSRASVC